MLSASRPESWEPRLRSLQHEKCQAQVQVPDTELVIKGLTRAGHGDDGPVEGLGQGVELGVRLVLLEGVGQARKDQHPHADCHGEQQQLPGGL